MVFSDDGICSPERDLPSWPTQNVTNLIDDDAFQSVARVAAGPPPPTVQVIGEGTASMTRAASSLVKTSFSLPRCFSDSQTSSSIRCWSHNRYPKKCVEGACPSFRRMKC